MTSSWIILYSFLILDCGADAYNTLYETPWHWGGLKQPFRYPYFDQSLPFRHHNINNDDNFICTNGNIIECSLVCDGHNNCSDGSDETKELCARYEYGTYMKMDCGSDAYNTLYETPWHGDGLSQPFSNPYFDQSLPFRHHNINNDDNFVCTNGLRIEWSLVCDGHNNCSDGSDETKELCARYEYGTNMTMDCGKEVNKTIHDTPWLAYIVQVNKLESKRIGFGSIIAPNVVVAMSDTFWRYDLKYKQNSINNGGRYLYSIEIAPKPNISNPYYIKAKMIYFVEDFDIRKPYNLAVIVLADKISFSNGVSAICIDWDSKYIGRNYNDKYQNLSILRQNEHNFATNVSNYICLDLYDKNNLSFIETFDKICITIIKITTGSKDGDKYYYENLNILHSDHFFLTGLRSYRSTINNNPALGFIDIKYHFPWIRGILNKHGTVNSRVLPTGNMCPPLLSDSLDIKCSYSGNYANCSNLVIPYTTAILSCKPTYYSSPNEQQDTPYAIHCQPNGIWNKKLYTCKPMNLCVLPTVEGVVYTYENSNERIPHGAFINHAVTVNENCEDGYHKAYPNAFKVCQINGEWKTVSDKLCLKMCPPLLSDSLDITCTLNGEDANCSNLSIPETKATPKCKPTHYNSPNGQPDTPLEIHCQSNGTWNKQLFTCTPYCGKIYTITHPLIAKGIIANVGTAPWNVGIYRMNKNDSNYDLKCGGSIIASNLVVSAAHCFWNKTLTSDTISVNDGRYKVAVGKYTRDFTVVDNTFTDIMDVEMVYLKDHFNEKSGYLADDIAIIVLKNRISFNDGVAPVCIDWTGLKKVSDGDLGKIVGWGKTDKGIESPVLLQTFLPYISNRRCRNKYSNGFQSYVTPDKFCAGFESVSDQGADSGDSGAGLCFLHSQYFFLTGVVSSKDPETNNSIAVFTEVKYHIEWIHKLFVRHN